MKHLQITFVIFLCALSSALFFSSFSYANSTDSDILSGAPVSSSLFASNNKLVEANSPQKKNNNDVEKGADTQTQHSVIFTYLIYALFIVGLLAVLALDTSGKHKSKRRHDEE